MLETRNMDFTAEHAEVAEDIDPSPDVSYPA